MLRLSIDITTGNLVAWQGSSALVPEFRQSEQDVELRFVQPVTGALYQSGQYEPADVTAYLGPRLGLWKKCTGTLEDSGANLLALTPHDEFTYITSSDQDGGLYAATPDAYPYFAGTFNTWTDEIAAWIGKGRSAAAYFAIGLVRANTAIEPLFDQRGATNCTVFAAADDGTGVAPVSVTALPGRQTFTLPVAFQTADGSKVWELSQDPANEDNLLFTRIQ